jgi:Putative transposase DNA-binding domain
MLVCVHLGPPPSEFGRLLTYKAAMTGASIVVADRWFPSSKTCSDCGHVHAGLTLSDREWVCEECGVIHDRDRNAAIKKFAASPGRLRTPGEGTMIGDRGDPGLLPGLVPSVYRQCCGQLQQADADLQLLRCVESVTCKKAGEPARFCRIRDKVRQMQPLTRSSWRRVR